jgi:hypothetical protein
VSACRCGHRPEGRYFYAEASFAGGAPRHAAGIATSSLRDRQREKPLDADDREAGTDARRVRLRHPHADRADGEALDERVGDCLGERLDQVEAPARGDLAHAVRHLSVVDGVLDPVRRARVADVEADVVEELLAVTALLLSRIPSGRNVRAYLSLMMAYALANAAQDAWNEQLWKREWVDREIASMLRPDVTWGWLAILLGATAIHVLWFAPARER